MTAAALVTVKPVVVFPQINVNIKPLAGAGKVHEGLALVETFIYDLPESAAVKTTVAPTNALFAVTDVLGPVGAAVKTGAAVKVATPVKAEVALTARVAVETAPVVVTFFADW